VKLRANSYARWSRLTASLLRSDAAMRHSSLDGTASHGFCTNDQAACSCQEVQRQRRTHATRQHLVSANKAAQAPLECSMRLSLLPYLCC